MFFFLALAGCAKTESGNGYPDTGANLDSITEADADLAVDTDVDIPVDADAETDIPNDDTMEAVGDPDVVEIDDPVVDVDGDPDLETDPDLGPLPGDNCDNTIDIIMSGSTASETGSTAGMHHDYDGPPACSISSSSLDIVYKVDMSAGNRINVDYTASGTMDCISIQRECPDTSLIGGCTCGDPTTTLEASREYDGDGTAYIFIWADGEKTFNLDIEVSPI